MPTYYSGAVYVFDSKDVLLTELSPIRFDPEGNVLSADHFDKIAPAYLKPLSEGEPFVTVAYLYFTTFGRKNYLEKHTPAGWRDGKVVGTEVHHRDWDKD